MRKIKTTKIGQKEYVDVSERVLFFNDLYPNYSLRQEIHSINEETGTVLIHAWVEDESGRVIRDGHAHEFQANKKSKVNMTSHIENCETSAVGRALGFLGLGTEYGIASADEVRNAKEKEAEMNQNGDAQEPEEVEKDKVIKIVTDAAKKKVEDEKPEVNVASDYASNTLVKDATEEELASITGKKPKPEEEAIAELEEILNGSEDPAKGEEEQEYLVDLNRRVSMLKNSKDAKALAEEGRKWSKNWTYKKDEYQTLYKCIAESFATYKRSEDQAKAAESKGGS